MWKNLAGHSSALWEASYAHKQATMYECLEVNCERLRIKSLEKSTLYKQWYASSLPDAWTLDNIFIGLLQQLKDPHQ